MNQSYDSEGKYIAKEGNPNGWEGRRVMVNGNNSQATWDMVFKISQVAVLPLLAAMFYMLVQMSALDRRLAIIEVTTARPMADVGLVQKLAVIEDRQNNVIKQLSENGVRIDRLSEVMAQHDDAAKGVVYRSPRR